MKSEAQVDGQKNSAAKSAAKNPKNPKNALAKRKASSTPVKRARKSASKLSGKSAGKSSSDRNAETNLVFSTLEIVSVATVATLGSIAAYFFLPKLFSFGSRRATGSEDVVIPEQSPFDLDVLPAP